MGFRRRLKRAAHAPEVEKLAKLHVDRLLEALESEAVALSQAVRGIDDREEFEKRARDFGPRLGAWSSKLHCIKEISERMIRSSISLTTTMRPRA